MNRKMKKTLLRVVHETDEVISVIVPAWDTGRSFQIEKHELPFKVKVSDRMMAKANFAARSRAEMFFEDYEKVPELSEIF